MVEPLQRREGLFTIADGDLISFKKKMLNWTRRFSIFLFLDSNQYTLQGGTYECLAAAGTYHLLRPEPGANALQQLFNAHQQHKDWLFGHICYDLKDELEPVRSSAHPPLHHFPVLQFFVPETVISIPTGTSEVMIATFGDPEAIFQELSAMEDATETLPELSFRQRMEQQEYLDKIDALREHIRNGDCYEINFCNEGFCEAASIDPVTAFLRLNQVSPAPFAACYRLDDHYLVCASPERYIRKTGDHIISQPIKGTARRAADPAADAALKAALYESEKERAENVMIVDLVRNDLARSCITGSVTVDELFGIYTFPQVHQMISTVSGTLRPDLPFTDALRYSFPMGSMTGAPKVKVMELIEQYEAVRRELFAGTVGYITPDGDFDFNVVIRSLFYNAATRYLSYQTGGAITWDSDPQSEWEEMRLKAGAMERIFKSDMKFD